MKLLWILLIVFGLNVQAQMRCEDLFPISNVGKIENFSKDASDFYSYATNMELRRLQIKYISMNEHEKVNAIQKFLNHNKVEFKMTIRWQWLPVPKRYEEIEILTTGSSETNRYAKKLADLYQTRLIYSPKQLAELQAYGAYSPDLSIIYISEFMAMTDKADLTFFHEVRHMAMTKREKKGEASIVNGFAQKLEFFSERWPWGRASKSGYTNYFSLQEAETWHQYFVYKLTHIRQLARDNKLSYSDLHKLIEQTKRNGSANMVEDTISLVEHEIGLAKKGSLSVSFESEKNLILFGKVGWPYSLGHTIPSKFIQKFLQQAHSDFVFTKESFKTFEGRQLSREIVSSYLRELHQNLVKKREFSQRNRELMQEIQRRAVYFEEDRKPIQGLFELIAQLGREKQWQAMSIDEVNASRLSRLNIEGLDFSKVHSSLYSKKSEKFDAEAANTFYEIKRFISSTAADDGVTQGYMKIELTYQHHERKGILVLEGIPSINFNRISIERLKAMGVKILQADIKIVNYSKIEKLDHSSLDVSYLKIPVAEVNARNQYRIDQLLEQLRTVFES